MSMTKDVTVAELQEHLTEHVQDVRAGTTLRVILDGKFVAELRRPGDPFDDLIARPPLRPMHNVDLSAETIPNKTPDDMVYRRARGSLADFVPPPPIESDVDVVALLREDRDAR